MKNKVFLKKCCIFSALLLATFALLTQARFAAFADDTSREIQTSRRLRGLCYGPYTAGNRPGEGFLDAAIYRRQLETLSHLTDTLYFFGIDDELIPVIRDANQMNFRIVVNIWIDPKQNLPMEVPPALLDGSFSYDAVVVGAEWLLGRVEKDGRDQVSMQALITYMDTVRKAIGNIPVGTADTEAVLLRHPELFSAADFILANLYPFWEGLSPQAGMEWLQERYFLLSALANQSGTPLGIGETGWPSGPEGMKTFQTGMEEAEKYLHLFTAWAHEHNVHYFYFAAFDEPWKGDNKSETGLLNKQWGLFTADGKEKPFLTVWRMEP